MVKKSEEKRETVQGMEDISNIWAKNSNEFLKMWGDTNLKVYKPWLEFIGEKSLKMTDMSMNLAPEKYKEFYDDWMKTYKSTYGKVYPVQISSPKETLEDFVKVADESNKVYMSWMDELRENSKRTAEALSNGNDPVKYKECFDSWLKTYEKVFDDMNDHPAIKYQREFFAKSTGMPDIYPQSFSKMAKQMKEIYNKFFVPSEETIQKFSESLAKVSKGEPNPEAYKELNDMLMNSYKETVSRMFDPQTMRPSKELLDNLKESTDISLNLLKSWTSALEKMSEKMQDQPKLINDPEAFREFYNLWIKMYEKTSEDIFEGVPVVGPMKEMMEPVKRACKVYASTSIKMSKMWIDSFSRMASAPRV